MIARDADSQALQLNSSPFLIQNSFLGSEVPSVSCELTDINISSDDFDQLMLQSLRDVPISLDGLSMDCDGASQNVSLSSTAAQPFCELTNMFLEDTKRPRDIGIPVPVYDSTLLTSFFESLNESAINVSQTSEGGQATPPFSGGSTPQTHSRAASPAWSESSGNMSASSLSGSSCQGKVYHVNLIPRHKRPSHRRAEVKRRDKIKTCLDDIKMQVPSLNDKGKLSESTILLKAAEYIHQLKDGLSERGNKASELRREIQCLSEEIHSFQETLPAAGLKEKSIAHPGLDDFYSAWLAEQSRISTKHYIFSSITSSLFDSFKEVVGNAITLDSMASLMKEWQTKYLSLPVLRKQILRGMLNLTRNSNVVTISCDLKVESSVDITGNS